MLFKIGLLAFKSLVGCAPEYLQDLFVHAHHGHSLKLIIPNYQYIHGNNSFSAIRPKLLNRLPKNVTSASDIDSFNIQLKTFLFNASELRTLLHSFLIIKLNLKQQAHYTRTTGPLSHYTSTTGPLCYVC